jgi:hypothetical protein
LLGTEKIQAAFDTEAEFLFEGLMAWCLAGGLSEGGGGRENEEEGGKFHDGMNWRPEAGGVNGQGAKAVWPGRFLTTP